MMTEADIVYAYQEGKFLREIASSANLAVAKIRSILVKNSVAIRKRGQVPIMTLLRPHITAICAMYKGGMSASEIAPKFDVNYSRILKILRGQNIPIRPSASYYSLSQENKRHVCEDYASGSSIDDVLEKNQISSSLLYRSLKELGIKNRDGRKKHLQINESFFEKLDSFEKAYLFGWMCSDGHNEKSGKAFTISLKTSDRYILQLFSYFISRGSIQIHDRQCKTKGKTHNVSKFSVTSKKLNADLAQLGCIHNKTHTLVWPKFLSGDLERWFLLGFFDGDGHVGLYKSGECNGKIYFKGIIEIYSTNNVCTAIQTLLSTMGIRSNIIAKPGCYALRFSDRNNILKFYNFVYQGSSFCLKRKHDKFKEIFETHALDYTDLWHNNGIDANFSLAGITTA